MGELTRRQLLKRGALAGVWAVPTVQGVSMLQSAAAAVSPAEFGCGAPAKNAAVRFKSFGNTRSREFYLGVGNLGDGDNRVERDLVWASPGQYPIVFRYEPGQPLYAKVTIAGTAYEQIYPVGSSLAPIDSFEIVVAQRDPGVTVSFRDVRLDGVLVGSGQFDGVDGVYGTWVFPAPSLNSGFEFTGTIHIDGSFPFRRGDERSKVEILTGCDVGNL